jgi:hypothetical protein
MAELGLPLTIKPGSLERQRGFMPMRLRREEAGVEFDVFDHTFEELAGNIDPRFERSANFRWGGAEDEMVSGLCAAAALAKLVDGVVLVDWESKLLSPDEVIALARETLEDVLKREAKHSRRTRPADIKRYLKPLLKQRSDLVVTDRMLLIRPVRHLLRGAFLDRTSDKYRFEILPYLKPLWSPRWLLEILDSIYGTPVWQPHFEPWLIDTLQQEVFTPLGKITSHNDLAGALPDKLEFFTTRVSALVLAGEHSRAEECIRNVENSERADHWQDEIKSMRDLLARDIKDVCAEFHAREAKAVKALKLEAIWEPSPFPVEVPDAERKGRTAEPMFVPEPWLPRPPGLLLDVPQASGEVFFGKALLFGRKEYPILVAALTRGEAEDRHRNGEHYGLAARLPGGLLLLLRRDGTDRRDPSPLSYAGDVYVELLGAHFRAQAEFWKDRDVEGMAYVRSLRISHRKTREREIWTWDFYRDDAEITIKDHRGSKLYREKKKVTEAETDQFKCLRPAFGEFDGLVRTVLGLLQSEGYGELE